MKSYTIGQVSKIVQLPTKTIRFYEEEGVLSPAQRADNGYRMYLETAIEELTLIKRARDLGLPVSEIKKLMKGCESGTCHHTMNEVSTSIDAYTQLLTDKINQFTLLRTKLQTLRDNICLNTEDCKQNSYCCNILRQLVE